MYTENVLKFSSESISIIPEITVVMDIFRNLRSPKLYKMEEMECQTTTESPDAKQKGLLDKKNILVVEQDSIAVSVFVVFLVDFDKY